MAKNYIDHLVRDGVNYPFIDTYSRHENLLHNPFFTVNQRGFSTQTETDGTSTYCVDRWKFVRGTVTKLINGVNYTARKNESQEYITEYKRFLQRVDYTPVIGDTFTMSMHCKVNDVTDGIYLCAFRNSSSLGGGYLKAITNTGEQYITHTFTIGEDFTSGYSLGIGIYGNNAENTGANIDIYSMKLERGEASTLQYDYPENNEIELIKCATSTIEPADTYTNKHLVFESN